MKKVIVFERERNYPYFWTVVELDSIKIIARDQFLNDLKDQFDSDEYEFRVIGN